MSDIVGQWRAFMYAEHGPRWAVYLQVIKGALLRAVDGAEEEVLELLLLKLPMAVAELEAQYGDEQWPVETCAAQLAASPALCHAAQLALGCDHLLGMLTTAWAHRGLVRPDRLQHLLTAPAPSPALPALDDVLGADLSDPAPWPVHQRDALCAALLAPATLGTARSSVSMARAWLVRVCRPWVWAAFRACAVQGQLWDGVGAVCTGLLDMPRDGDEWLGAAELAALCVLALHSAANPTIVPPPALHQWLHASLPPVTDTPETEPLMKALFVADTDTALIDLLR